MSDDDDQQREDEVTAQDSAVLDLGDLGSDVPVAPELTDDELGATLEALLLVVDAPVPVDALASAVDQSVQRVTAKLHQIAEELTARDSGIDLRRRAVAGGCTPAAAMRPTSSGSCSTARDPN